MLLWSGIKSRVAFKSICASKLFPDTNLRQKEKTRCVVLGSWRPEIISSSYESGQLIGGWHVSLADAEGGRLSREKRVKLAALRETGPYLTFRCARLVALFFSDDPPGVSWRI